MLLNDVRCNKPIIAGYLGGKSKLYKKNHSAYPTAYVLCGTVLRGWLGFLEKTRFQNRSSERHQQGTHNAL